VNGAHVRDKKNSHITIVGKTAEKRPLKGPRSRKIISRRILKKEGMRAWNGFIWLKTEFSSWLL
jgi:hypothetical protein